MSNIDKQALREAAEKALNARARLALMESVFDDDGDDVKPEAQEDISICVSFNELTNPATVLALLDELEAKDRRNAELNSTLERWAVDRAQSESELDEADKRIAEVESQRRMAFMACNRWADKFREAEKRIAELEARKFRVNLPRPGFMTTGNHGFAKNDVLASLREAGIKLEVGE